MSSQFEVHLPDELRPLLDQFGVSASLEDRVRLSIVVALFTSHKITLARAAELYGVTLGSFMDLLNDQGIPWLDYSDEDQRLDDRTIAKLLSHDEA